MRRGSVADAMLLVTVCLWALNFTASKYILDHGFRPLTYAGIRYAIAAVIFLVLVLPRERSLRIERRDLPLVGGAIVLLFLNQIGFVFAVDLTTATTVALLFGTLPIFTALIARLVGMEQLSGRFWIAAALSFSGVALVSVGSGNSLSANLDGDLLAIMSAAMWGGYSVALAPLMRRYSPYRLSAIFLVVVSIALLVAGAPQLGDQSFDLSGLVWLSFVYAVLGPLVITNLLWFSAIDRVGPSRASLFANLQPFLAALIALVLLHESLSVLQVAGGLLIAAGIVFSRGRQPPPEPA
ncbi:MAG: DMT family transporter [Actinomycetota bacterium]